MQGSEAVDQKEATQMQRREHVRSRGWSSLSVYMLTVHTLQSSERQSYNFWAYSDCHLQVVSVLEADRVEPAGDEEGDCALYEGVIECLESVVIYSKRVEEKKS